MWPGVYSLASDKIPLGGTAMFALLAFAGDTGCSAGPTAVGYISKAFDNNLSVGMLFSVFFPALMLVGLLMLNKITKKDV